MMTPPMNSSVQAMILPGLMRDRGRTWEDAASFISGLS